MKEKRSSRMKKPLFKWCCTWGMLVWLVLNPLQSQAKDTSNLPNINKNAEYLLISILESVSQLQYEKALSQAVLLKESYPNYRLAKLLYADLLAIKAHRLASIEKIHQYPEIKKLISEAKVRWHYAHQPVSAKALRDYYIVKSPQGQHHAVPYIVLVDLSQNRLFLYKKSQGQYQSILNYYITLGQNGYGKQKQGDRRTPVGIYQIKRFIPDKKLPELYGVGALTLDYPNIWDKYLGRTGYGIWLHGTPRKVFSRAPKDSKGCVVLENQAMQMLIENYQLPKQTPVFLVASDQISKRDNMSNAALSDEVKDVMTRFLPKNISWDEVGVYRYPNEKGLVYITYPLLNQKKQKKEEGVQLWRLHASGWTLVLQSPQILPPNMRQKSIRLASNL